jgi:hypothetical protein
MKYKSYPTDSVRIALSFCKLQEKMFAVRPGYPKATVRLPSRHSAAK